MKPKHKDAFCTKVLVPSVSYNSAFVLTEKLGVSGTELRPGNLTGTISQTTQQEHTATKHVHIFEQIFSNEFGLSLDSAGFQ